MNSTTKEEYFKLHSTVNVLDGFVAEFVRQEQNGKDALLHANILNAIQQKRREIYDMGVKDSKTNNNYSKKNNMNTAVVVAKSNTNDSNQDREELSSSPRLLVIESLRRYLLELQDHKEQWYLHHPCIILMCDDGDDVCVNKSHDSKMATQDANRCNNNYNNNDNIYWQHEEAKEKRANALQKVMHEVVNELKQRIAFPVCVIEPTSTTLRDFNKSYHEYRNEEESVLHEATHIHKENQNGTGTSNVPEESSEAEYLLAECDEKMSKYLQHLRAANVANILQQIKQFDVQHTECNSQIEQHILTTTAEINKRQVNNDNKTSFTTQNSDITPVILIATQWPRSIADVLALRHDVGTPATVLFFTNKCNTNTKTNNENAAHYNGGCTNTDLSQVSSNNGNWKSTNDIKTMLRMANREAVMNGELNKERNALLAYYRSLNILHEVHLNYYVREEVVKHVLHTLHLEQN